MEQELFEMFLEERIAEFCREYSNETGDREGTSDDLEQILEALPKEQREKLEDVFIGQTGQRDMALYRFGIQDGIRIMLRIMEIRD